MQRNSSKESMSNLFNRYVRLTDLIYRRRKITYEEINEAWRNSELNYRGEDIPLKTFHNHRHAFRGNVRYKYSSVTVVGATITIPENAEDVERGGVKSMAD